MNDPLAQYRKKPLGAVTEPPQIKGPDEYVAFDAKDKVDRLSIRLADRQARTPSYGYLLDIAHDEPGTSFMLYYSFMMIVLVAGRNLRPVIMAIQMGTAEFIQEYDPARWPKPKDEKAPFIESIQITMEQGGPPTPQNGKDKAFDLMRDRVLIETQAEHLLAVLRTGTVSTNAFLRKVHNFAVDMNWLPATVIPRRQCARICV